VNKNRRERINTLIKTFEELVDTLEEIHGEEQEYFDNMPENIQQSEKGEQTQSAINCLENAVDNLGDLISNLKEAAE
jgi:hypothetical protein